MIYTIIITYYYYSTQYSTTISNTNTVQYYNIQYKYIHINGENIEKPPKLFYFGEFGKTSNIPNRSYFDSR